MLCSFTGKYTCSTIESFNQFIIGPVKLYKPIIDHFKNEACYVISNNVVFCQV